MEKTTQQAACSCGETVSRVEEMCAACLAEYVAWWEAEQQAQAHYAALIRGRVPPHFERCAINWNLWRFEPPPPAKVDERGFTVHDEKGLPVYEATRATPRSRPID